MQTLINKIKMIIDHLYFIVVTVFIGGSFVPKVVLTLLNLILTDIFNVSKIKFVKCLYRAN